jgi:hypothetical protein
MFGAMSVASVACTGTIAEPTNEEFDQMAQSKENLLRAVDASKELLITDKSVIESPLETTFDYKNPSGSGAKGAWTFGRLIHNMLPKGKRDDKKAASKFMFEWLGQWEANQSPNPLVTTSLARSTIRSRVIDPWKAASGCTGSDDKCVLDMGKAPFRLIAIVYRPDLRKAPSAGDPGFGGEGRFVFNLLDASGNPVKETVIFEYSLPIWTSFGTLTWAYRWHLLGAFPFGSTYNALLRFVTDGFTGEDADPRRPNGNALNQLRTNEVVLKHLAGCHPDGSLLPTGLCKPADATTFPTQKLWELREFRINAQGKLAQHAMAMDPSRDFDAAPRFDGTTSIGSGTRSAELADYLMANQAAVEAGTHTIPKAWLSNSTYIGSGVPQWGVAAPLKTSAGVAIPESVRAGFALQTCGGCHRHEVSGATGSAPTPTFLHIYDPRALDPAEANDQAAIAQHAGDPSQTGISDFVAKEIAVGGPRYQDFSTLLATNPLSLIPAFKGKKVCHGTYGED